jgi:hypothetical protein
MLLGTIKKQFQQNQLKILPYLLHIYGIPLQNLFLFCVGDEDGQGCLRVNVTHAGL